MAADIASVLQTLRRAGSEPAELRRRLAAALPRAPGPEGQMVKEPTILHTTLARLLSPLQPVAGAHMWRQAATLHNRNSRHGIRGSSDGVATDENGGGDGDKAEAAVPEAALLAAVEALSIALCGLQAEFNEFWFVQEKHVLALGLGGEYESRRLPLSCHGNGRQAADT